MLRNALQAGNPKLCRNGKSFDFAQDKPGTSQTFKTPSREDMEREEDLFKKEPPKEHSIFDFYSIGNEARFIREEGTLSKEEKAFYLQQNVFRFLGEFVGRVNYTKVNYFLKEGRLFYPGVKNPVLQSYKRAAYLEGEGSREWVEAAGFQQIEKELGEEDHNMAVWISPPSNTNEFGDYGFVFVFLKDRDSRVREYVLRYPEKKQQLPVSNAIFSKILLYNTINIFSESNLLGSGLTNKDFLGTPIILQSKNPDESLIALSAIMGFDCDMIIASQEFEKTILEELSSWIGAYVISILALAEFDESSLEYKMLEMKAKSFLTGLYNRATEIKEILDNKKEKKEKELVPLSFYYYSQKPAMIMEGGSCPVSSSNSFSILRYSQGKIGYHEADLLTKSNLKILNCVTCPFCKHTVDAQIAEGRITCPKCKKSAPYSES